MANSLAWISMLPTPDILHQDFESGVIPPGWSNLSGAPNYGYTPALVGNFSLGLSSGDFSKTTFTSSSEAFVYMVANLGAATGNTFFLRLYNDTSLSTVGMYLNITSDKLTVFDTGQVHSAQASALVPANTTIYIWLHYKAGSGANAILSVAWDTVNVEPTTGSKFASMNIGASTTNLGALVLSGIAGMQVVIDNFGIATFDMPGGW